MASSLPETALARWLADGVTSHTHPVLAYALRTYFHPIGILADWLEAEPFSDLENAGGGWWLRGAAWSAERFDRSGAAAADFAYLLDHADQFQIRVGGQGRIELSAAAGDPGAQNWCRQSDSGWAVIRHSVEAAETVEAFIYAAAGSLLANNSAAILYSEGNTDEFCRAIGSLLETRG